MLTAQSPKAETPITFGPVYLRLHKPTGKRNYAVWDALSAVGRGSTAL